MARRDFTINAMADPARRTASLVDPFGGVADLERRELRTVGPTSFEDDPLRLVRALRFVSQLDFDLAPETLAQMEAAAPGPRARLRRADRRRDQGRRAWASCRSCCSAGEPARALLLARDTGVLDARDPGVRAARSATRSAPSGSRCRSTSTSSPSCRTPPTAAPARGAARRACSTISASRRRSATARATPHRARALADAILERLRYPTRVRHHVVADRRRVTPSRSTGRSTPASPAASSPSTATSSRAT